MENLKIGAKVIVDKPVSFNNVSDIKVTHTSIKYLLKKTFKVRGYSKYIFDIETMQSIGREKLKVRII